MSRILHNISRLILFLLLFTGTGAAEENQVHIAVAAESTELTSSKIQTVERQGRVIDVVKEQNNAQK